MLNYCTTQDLEIKITLKTKGQELYFNFKVLGGPIISIVHCIDSAEHVDY